MNTASQDDARTVRSEWNLACPGCKSDEHLRVSIKTWAALTVDGTEPVGDHEWDHDSPMHCVSCNWTGTGWEAEVAKSFGHPSKPETSQQGQDQ